MNDSAFVIGVTGHRDIDPADMDSARAAITSFLSDVRGHMPDTDLVVISGLADGADRLAASVALELGIAVHAILPMAQDEYEKDFAPESVTEFRQLLAAEEVKSTELQAVQINSAIDRDACYRRLTDCLIRKSNILLAMWDGVDTGLIGGTSDTLLSFLSDTNHVGGGLGGMEIVSEPPVSGHGHEYAYWIQVRRSRETTTSSPSVNSNGMFVSGVPETRVLVAQQEMPVALQDQLRQLNTYGTDFNSLRQRVDSLPTWGLPEISDECRASDADDLLSSIEREFDRADSLAIHFQSRSDRLFKAFSFVAAMLGLLFLTYAKLVASNVFLYGYVALFFAGYLVFKVAGSRRWFAKHIMYRVIAETLRIKFFLRLAGADDLVNVNQIARQAGIDKFSGFSWIGHVFKRAEPVVPGTVGGEIAAQRLTEARNLWVADQSAYFSKKIHSMHHRHHRVERIKQVLLGATLVGIVVLILFKYPLLTEIPGTELPYKKLFVFFMGLFPFWLGVWEIYHNKMATKELLWQYRNQADGFALSEFQLGRVGSVDQQRKLLAKLATGALFENYLWTIHRFHREHEPPAAG